MLNLFRYRKTSFSIPKFIQASNTFVIVKFICVFCVKTFFNYSYILNSINRTSSIWLIEAFQLLKELFKITFRSVSFFSKLSESSWYNCKSQL